jgi:hypothetical protein
MAYIVPSPNMVMGDVGGGLLVGGVRGGFNKMMR